MSYVPPKELLEKYANLLVCFALNSGEGIRKGEVVHVTLPECAKPFFVPLRNAVLKAGGHPLMHLTPDDIELPEYFQLASDEQLDFFASHYYKGLVDQMDHHIGIIADNNKHELEGVDPKRLMRAAKARYQYRQWRTEKESAGKFTWTLALYGTEEAAAEVGMSLEEYWEQIIQACYLNEADPIAVWKKKGEELEVIKKKLNVLEVSKFHVESEDADLWIGCGPHRQWLGGGGRNIPSFELFISPDWRGTEGWIHFNQPLYYMGGLIDGVTLKFAKGLVVEATASKNEKLLKEMIAVKNADKIGEFSLTDGRFSHITRFMGETLYDENRGGEEGNTHIAVGDAYQDSYTGDPSTVTPEEWEKMGYNRSVVHTDIVSIARRKVTAHLQDGGIKVIYQNGKFTV